jgi:hypothetical protein
MATDGYLQLKQRELDEKIKTTEETLKSTGLKIERLEKKIGNYGELIEKIKDIDGFQEFLTNQCTKEASDATSEFVNKVINTTRKQVVDYLSKIDEKLLNRALGTSEKAIKIIIKDRLDELNTITENHTELLLSIFQLKTILRDLIKHLISRGIITKRQAVNIEAKSQKEAKNKLKKLMEAK